MILLIQEYELLPIIQLHLISLRLRTQQLTVMSSGISSITKFYINYKSIEFKMHHI